MRIDANDRMLVERVADAAHELLRAEMESVFRLAGADEGAARRLGEAALVGVPPEGWLPSVAEAVAGVARMPIDATNRDAVRRQAICEHPELVARAARAIRPEYITLGDRTLANRIGDLAVDADPALREDECARLFSRAAGIPEDQAPLLREHPVVRHALERASTSAPAAVAAQAS